MHTLNCEAIAHKLQPTRCANTPPARFKVGKFSDALMAEAKQKDWTDISMKIDWKCIFAFEP